MLLTAGSAPEIAAAAQAFGQEDDIRVVIVTRTPGAEPSVTSDTANVAEPGLVLTNQAAQIAG